MKTVLDKDGVYSDMFREYMAEFTGVAILIIFGTGVDCQVVLSSVTGVASSQKGVSTFCHYLSSRRLI